MAKQPLTEFDPKLVLHGWVRLLHDVWWWRRRWKYMGYDFSMKIAKKTMFLRTVQCEGHVWVVWSLMKIFGQNTARWTKLSDHSGRCKDWAILTDSWSNPQKTRFASGNQIEKHEGKRREAGGREGSGGTRGEAGGSGGEAGKQQEKKGGKKGGKVGKNRVRGSCAILSSKGNLEPVRPPPHGLLWFCVCVSVFGPFGGWFSPVCVFGRHKQCFHLVPTSVRLLWSSQFDVHHLVYFGDTPRKISRAE